MLDNSFWKKYFEEYDALNDLEPYQNVLERIILELSVETGDEILDAGSGTGNLAVKIEARGATVVGLDSSIEGIEIHKRKIPHALVVRGDLGKKLPFADASFDKICSNNTIYTLSKSLHGQIFSEFYRVLKSGGKVVVSNPCEGFSPLLIYLRHLKVSARTYGLLTTFKKICALLVPTIKIFYYNILIKQENRIGNYNFFKPGEQANLLKQTGFTEVSQDFQVYADQAILNVAKKA